MTMDRMGPEMFFLAEFYDPNPSVDRVHAVIQLYPGGDCICTKIWRPTGTRKSELLLYIWDNVREAMDAINTPGSPLNDGPEYQMHIASKEYVKTWAAHEHQEIIGGME